ncbi:hypothetical protein QFZ49_006309 [Streptomyces turgidiscabies]|uniref:Transposase n=1 Tax=Streptomyces turgidiscabies TaxID=85558 RepID=A0ABU0RWH4_9ACTN|nr:hypothetical protein [Streptomyces turgidiscabies]
MTLTHTLTVEFFRRKSKYGIAFPATPEINLFLAQ